jgi:hypothetical protein
MPKRILKSVKSVPVRTSIVCSRIYPVMDSRIEFLKDLTTVGVKLSALEAMQLATNILLGLQGGWPELTLTANRNKNRLTVTTQ